MKKLTTLISLFFLSTVIFAEGDATTFSYFQQAKGWILDNFHIWGPKVGITILGLVITYLAAGFFRAIATRIVKGIKGNSKVRHVVGKTTHIVVMLIGITMTLDEVGVNVGALIAGAGVGGLAVAFALKDTIADVVAGIKLFVFEPCKMGDIIEVGGMSGKVELIDLRSTTLSEKTNENEYVLTVIQNSWLYSRPIKVKVNKERYKKFTEHCEQCKPEA